MNELLYKSFNDDNGFFNEWLLKEKEKKITKELNYEDGWNDDNLTNILYPLNVLQPKDDPDIVWNNQQ
jgi:hypothetical protein